MSFFCTPLPWDSDYWGFSVAKISGDRLTAASAKSAIEWCEETKIRCLYFAADGSCAETLKAARENGFQFVDVRIDMERTCSGLHPEDSGEGFCRVAIQKDLAAMEQLARISHYDTRFFKDTNFDRTKACDLYALWIARDFKEHTVFAAVSSVQPAKVLGYLSASALDADTSRIGLLAVSTEARGRGLARELVQHALLWSRSRSIARVRVATQGTNVPALRVYESCGFKVVDVKIWFHRWFKI